MNSSQNRYPDIRNMDTIDNSGARNLTTRSMQPGVGMPRMNDGMRMPNMQNMPVGQNMRVPGMQQTAPMWPGMESGLAGQTGGLTQMPVITPEFLAMQTPTTVASPYFTAGFLKNFIGKNMRVEFLIGTSGALVDRTGVLMEVGASYIVIRPTLTDDLLMCDLYSIRFVTIYQ